MGGKRGNDNAQLSKEEYEAQLNSSSADASAAGGFQRASSELLAKRKIVRVRR